MPGKWSGYGKWHRTSRTVSSNIWHCANHFPTLGLNYLICNLRVRGPCKQHCFWDLRIFLTLGHFLNFNSFKRKCNSSLTVICHVDNKRKTETSIIATFLWKLLETHFQKLCNASQKIYSLSLDYSFIFLGLKSSFVLDVIYSGGKGSGRFWNLYSTRCSLEIFPYLVLLISKSDAWSTIPRFSPVYFSKRISSQQSSKPMPEKLLVIICCIFLLGGQLDPSIELHSEGHLMLTLSVKLNFLKFPSFAFNRLVTVWNIRVSFYHQNSHIWAVFLNPHAWNFYVSMMLSVAQMTTRSQDVGCTDTSYYATRMENNQRR